MYNRKTIPELDPRQCVYIDYHTQLYGTQNLVINGETYEERTEKTMPTNEKIKNALKGYEDREAYLWSNARGWCLIFRTEKNEKMFVWDKLKKVN